MSKSRKREHNLSLSNNLHFFYDSMPKLVMCRYKSRWNIDLKWKPFFLGGIMKETGNKPPASVPAKGVYMFQDIERLGDYTKVPVKIPGNMMELIMTGTLKPQRFITAVDMKYPHHTEEISRKFWTRIYDTNEDVMQVDSFKQIGKQVGLKDDEIDDAIARIGDNLTKERLKDYTKQAVEYGAFGAPTIVAHIKNKPELLFGSDRFELLAHMMGEKWLGPLPESKI